MRRLMKKFEDMMVAITFAEAGEYDAANEITAELKEHGEDETRPEPEAA